LSALLNTDMFSLLMYVNFRDNLDIILWSGLFVVVGNLLYTVIFILHNSQYWNKSQTVPWNCTYFYLFFWWSKIKPRRKMWAVAHQILINIPKHSMVEVSLELFCRCLYNVYFLHKFYPTLSLMHKKLS